MEDVYKTCQCGLTKIKSKIVNLKAGDRVRGLGKEKYDNYTGVVYSINVNNYNEDTATIKRDNKVASGAGVNIPGYGSGWLIYKTNGFWKSNLRTGDYLQGDYCERCITIRRIKE